MIFKELPDSRHGKQKFCLINKDSLFFVFSIVSLHAGELQSFAVETESINENFYSYHQSEN